jgi:TolB-like protein
MSLGPLRDCHNCVEHGQMNNALIPAISAAGAPPPPDRPRKKKGKVRSAWISFVGRITAQMVGSAATVVLGLYLVDHSVRRAAAAAAPTSNAAAVSRPTVPIDPGSIVVLPLQNMSGDAAQEYLADSVTDGIITELARARHLRVVSRTSSMAYKGRPRMLSTTASELGVGMAVEGSVQKVGDRVHVTVQLVDAAADALLWTGTHDEPFTDALTVREAAASAVARDLMHEIEERRAIGAAAREVGLIRPQD